MGYLKLMQIQNVKILCKNVKMQLIMYGKTKVRQTFLFVLWNKTLLLLFSLCWDNEQENFFWVLDLQQVDQRKWFETGKKLSPHLK